MGNIIQELIDTPIQCLGIIYAILYSVTYFIYHIVKIMYSSYIMKSKSKSKIEIEIEPKPLYPDTNIDIDIMDKSTKDLRNDYMIKQFNKKDPTAPFQFVKSEDLKRSRQLKKAVEKKAEDYILSEKIDKIRRDVQDKLFKADKKGKKKIRRKKKHLPKVVKRELKEAGYLINKIVNCMEEYYDIMLP